MLRTLAEWRAATEYAWDDRDFEGEEISELLDEIERLRAALDKIIEAECCGCAVYVRIASEALNAGVA